jgi:hypothetical protein
MAYPVWDIRLPQLAQQEDMSRQMNDARLLTPMDGGPPKIRRRFSNAVMPVNLPVIMNTNELAVFDEFWSKTLTDEGIFWRPDPLKNDPALLEDPSTVFVDSSNNPLPTLYWWLCQFSDTPSVTRDGLEWRLMMPLTIIERWP